MINSYLEIVQKVTSQTKKPTSIGKIELQGRIKEKINTKNKKKKFVRN